MKIQLKIRRYPSFATDSRGKLGAKSIPIYLFVYSCIRFSMSRNMNLYIPTSKESMSRVCQVQNNQSTKKSGEINSSSLVIHESVVQCWPKLVKIGQVCHGWSKFAEAWWTSYVFILDVKCLEWVKNIILQVQMNVSRM